MRCPVEWSDILKIWGGAVLDPKRSIITFEWIVRTMQMNYFLSPLSYPVPKIFNVKHDSSVLTEHHRTRGNYHFAVSRHHISTKAARIICKLPCKWRVPISEGMCLESNGKCFNRYNVFLHLYSNDVILLI